METKKIEETMRQKETKKIEETKKLKEIKKITENRRNWRKRGKLKEIKNTQLKETK